MYYEAYTCIEVPVGTTDPILVQRYTYVLHNLFLCRGTRRYYRTYTYTEVPVGTTDLILIQRYP